MLHQRQLQHSLCYARSNLNGDFFVIAHDILACGVLKAIVLQFSILHIDRNSKRSLLTKRGRIGDFRYGLRILLTIMLYYEIHRLL